MRKSNIRKNFKILNWFLRGKHFLKLFHFIKLFQFRLLFSERNSIERFWSKFDFSIIHRRIFWVLSFFQDTCKKPFSSFFVFYNFLHLSLVEELIRKKLLNQIKFETSKKIKFSYQGIVIARKMNDGKSFEFNFTITVAIRIASAIAIIMKK